MLQLISLINIIKRIWNSLRNSVKVNDLKVIVRVYRESQIDWSCVLAKVVDHVLKKIIGKQESKIRFLNLKLKPM